MNISEPKKFATIGQDVIRLEADALVLLHRSIGDDFAAAIDLILSATGRVIVSGIGKSGHIARKIAATFASTGTPAHFVHPAEASHGDLGMMAQGDIALVLSNSGETPELSDVITYTRRFNIPLIGIASKPESNLIKQSDIALILPPAEEACGSGIVPSTSTTMTLALGDALAITLMKHRHFGPEHFREFHPGGKLGARLSKVRDLMHTGAELPLVGQNAPMSEVLISISQKGFGVTGVVDDKGLLCGIITDGDLRRHMDGLMTMTAAEIMTPSPKTIRPGALAEEAVAKMAGAVTCLFVADADGASKPLGILHIHDCLRAGIV